MHMEANKIADEGYHFSGWYCGNRAQFVERHKRAMAMMRDFLGKRQMEML